MQRSDTQTISIAAPPAQVLALVGDPQQLPLWAPDFARSIRPDGEDWLVETGAGELRIQVRVSPELGTVDFLAAGLPAGMEVGRSRASSPTGPARSTASRSSSARTTTSSSAAR